MTSLVLYRLTHRYIRRRVFQSVLFVLGIALGVGVGVAIDLANSSASRAFGLSVNTITGRATHQIVGASGSLPTTLYANIRTELGATKSAPVIQTNAQATSVNNRTLRLLGIDLFAEAAFRDYLVPPHEISSEELGTALFALISRPNTAFISETLAEKTGLTIGDSLEIHTRTNGNSNLEIVGWLYPSETASETALTDLIVTDIATAQELIGEPGRITRIDLLLPEDFDVSALTALLPPGATITQPSVNQNALSQMTDAFELNLQALSLLALLVGVFLIYNTVTFSVVQRRPVIGILRSIGTTRRQVFALILLESLILGTIGTILGLGLGVVLGQGTVSLVSQTVNDLYFRVQVNRVSLNAPTLLKGAVIGITASLVAAAIPSYEATRTPPAGILRRSSIEQNSRRMVPALSLAATILAISGVAVLQIPSNSLSLSFSALFMVLVGCTLLTPLAMMLTMRLASPLTERALGIIGRMAPRAVVRSLSRTAVTVAALTLAVSVIVGISIMISSFRNTVQNWLDITLAADIYISPSNEASGLDLDIDPAIVGKLSELDGVQEIATVRSTKVIAPDYPDLSPVNLVAPNRDITDNQRRFAWLHAEDFWPELEAGNIVVSEPFAFRRNITPSNNTITLLTNRGKQTFTVMGVYYDYTSDQGALLMHADIYHQYFDDPYLSAVALILSDPTKLDSVLTTLQSDTLVGTGLSAQSNRNLRAEVLAIFDRTFAITVALRLLATIVAFIGILSTLLSLQLEHTRQYGIMRANGMTPRQLRIFTFLQTGLMGITAGILAAPIGLALAYILVEVINVRSFGWTMTLILQPTIFIQAFVVAVAAALTASIYPAWRLGKLLPATALRSE